MTMALAAHAANDGETVQTVNNNNNTTYDDADKEYPHDNGGCHHQCQSSLAVADTSGTTTKKLNRACQDSTAHSRRGIPPPSNNGSGGDGGDGGSRRRFIGVAAATPASCQGMSSTDKVRAQGGETAEAGGHLEEDGPTTVEEENKAARVRAQMSVLMVGFFEVIRQVRWGAFFWVGTSATPCPARPTSRRKVAIFSNFSWAFFCVPPPTLRPTV